MRYLVDANVLSEPTKPAPDPKVVDWLRRHEREIAVDPIVLGEVRFGILLLRKGRKRARLEQWFDAGIERLNCLPIDAQTGRRWAQLVADLQAAGRAMPIKGQPDRGHRPCARPDGRHAQPGRLRQRGREDRRPVCRVIADALTAGQTRGV